MKGSTVLVAGRYQLREVLGRGASGAVWLAHDSLTGQELALKWWSAQAEDAGRWRRETTVLRVLSMPGMVRIVDHGVEDSRPFLVMERVSGAPFPNAARSDWQAVSLPALTLLDTLAQVHDAGFVHRDIKPNNVLVDADGRSVLLDFGLARATTGGHTITQAGMVVGTPAYMAPEVLLGERPTARSDLYSFGVMLYEALVGVVPHEDASGSFIAARIQGRPAPVPRDVPTEVRAVLALLLHANPASRPPSAHEVLRALRPQTMPWLGPEPRWNPDRGGVHRIYGPRGSGRTAWVRRVVRHRSVRWIHPRPGDLALAQLLDQDPPQHATLASVEAQIRRALVGLERDDTWLVVDDMDCLDARSAQLLHAAPPRLVTLGLTARPHRADLPIPCLQDRDLRELFEGPDLLLHLREDAAQALLGHTEGWPGMVVEELARWERSGIVTRAAGRWTITREALDGLRAAPPIPTLPASEGLHTDEDAVLAIVEVGRELSTPQIAAVVGRPRWRIEATLRALLTRGDVLCADAAWRPLRASTASRRWTADERASVHGSIAGALCPGAAQRWQHLALAGRADDCGVESIDRARALWEEGRLGEARSLVERVLELVRAEGSKQVEGGLLELLAFLSFSSFSREKLEEARYALERSARVDDPELLTLLNGAIAALRGRGDEAWEVLDQCAPASRERETWAYAYRAMSARSMGLKGARRAMANLERGALASGNPGLVARVQSWMGLLAYERGAFDEAIERMTSAAQVPRRRLSARLSFDLNYGWALVDGGRLVEARGVAIGARELARGARLPLYESRALTLLRAVGYRDGSIVLPDPEIPVAVRALGNRSAACSALLTEACIAWRAGEMDRAAEWAMEASTAYTHLGMGAQAAFARVLASTCGVPTEPEEDEPLRSALALAPAGIRWQCAALRPDLVPDAGPEPSGDPTVRLELLSMREVRRQTRGLADRGMGMSGDLPHIGETQRQGERYGCAEDRGLQRPCGRIEQHVDSSG